MKKTIGIGRVSKLSNLGDLVSVVIDGKTITAKVAKNLSSTSVLVLFDGKTYYVYPQSHATQTKAKTTILGKYEKRISPKQYRGDAVIVYKVRYNNGNTVPCTYNYWNYYNGIGCARACGVGIYNSLAECNQANQSSEPSIFDDKYSVGYFKRGFLSVLGAPSTELGFFYPITTGSPDYNYCPGMFFPTGYTQPGAESSVITGDGQYTYRRWILPAPKTLTPYDIYLPSTDTRVLQHSYYPDSNRITAAVLQQWSSLYNLSFYSNGTGILFTGNSDQLMGDNIPWEAALPRLNPDGSLITQPGIDGQPSFKWIGYPNWLWRQIDIKAIAIYDTIYFNGTQSAFYQDTFIINAGQNRRFLSADPSFTYTNIRRPSSVLPPASIISRTYSEEEETPVPPGSDWELLWDTKTCPSVPPVELDFDKDMYYVSVNGREPRLLGVFRSDDNVQVYVTNLGNGRYRCVLRSGTRSANGIQYFAETKIFTSESESSFIYNYPDAIPLTPEDWQDFRYRDWRIIPIINPDVDICLQGFSGPGLNVMPTTKILTEIEIPDDLVTQGTYTKYAVRAYTSIPASETSESRCDIVIVKTDMSIFLAALNTSAPLEDVQVLAISVYSNMER